jgi:hypothetical protein
MGSGLSAYIRNRTGLLKLAQQNADESGEHISDG